jgi:hypothetical protein
LIVQALAHLWARAFSYPFIIIVLSVVR